MRNPIKRILLIRTDRIGDVILTTPAATILKQRFPGLHITFLGRDYTEPLLKYHKHIDEILIYRPGGEHEGIKGHLKLAREIRARKFDAAILFYPRPWLAGLIWLARIPLRIGGGYRWYSFLLNKRIYEHRKHGKKHELEHNLTLLSPVVKKLPGDVQFEFKETPELIRWRHKSLKELAIGSNYIILHPGNGGSAPNLSILQYRFILNFLLENSRYQVLLTGTPAEKGLIEAILKEPDSKRVFNASGKFNMEQLMAIVSGSKLFISSSTGPLHIANAYHVPVVGFYCPAPPCSPRRWGPYHQQEWVLTPDVTPCNHCHPVKCPNGNCMELIAENAIKDILARRLKSIRIMNK